MSTTEHNTEPFALGERFETLEQDPANLTHSPEGSLASRAEIAVGWLPQQSHCRAHIFIDGELVGGASASGGRLFIAIPPGKYAPGRLFTIALRFFTGGWRCQVWLRTTDESGNPALKQKLHETQDPDPSDPNDDRLVWSVTLP